MVNDPPDSSKERLACDTCQKQFGRLEHLKRHELSHESPKFRCISCGKAFFRKDGLERHELTHQTSTSLVQKRARACRACATAKVRCSGEKPACRRCSGRRWQCSYPIRDEAYPESADSRQTADEEFPEDTYIHSYQPVNESPAINEGLVASGPQVLTDGDNTNIGGYLNDWDSSMFNINWLPLHPVELDLSDPSIHFPFQQSANMNILDDTSNRYNNVENESWNAAPPRSVVGTFSQRPVEHSSYPTVSASPASVLNSVDSTCNPESPTRTTNSGEFYVDGNGARLPHIKRRRLTSASYSRSMASPGMSLGCPPVLSVLNTDYPLIGEPQYAQISDLYQRLCLLSNFFQPFVETELLPREAFSNLIDSFVTNVHPWFPVLHLPTFDVANLEACLALAMAALGARHHEIEDGEALSLALLEFLRRIFLHLSETSGTFQSPSEGSLQAQFWYVVGAKFSGVRALEISADEILGKIISESLPATNHLVRPISSISDEPQWHLWAKFEEQRRLRLSIWLFDSIVAAENQTTPTLNLAAITTIVLPSHETLWTASSVPSIIERCVRYQQAPDVSNVLQCLYMNKKLSADLGEFAQLLITHCVIQRTREARLHLQHDLAGFEPTAERRPIFNSEMQTANRQRSTEAYQRWKNAACDSIDILHWSANSMIGAASGMEHPGVLHLHFARVILLSPIKEIVALGRHLSHLDTPNALSDGVSLQERQQPIRQWVIEDPYKARLAAIHAGVIFWHVRRYSANAFYEAGAVAQSALMLWALSAFSNHNNDNRREQGERQASVVINEPPSPDTCDIILIDRPTDDVLVQQFVRQGQTMQAIMTGVGNLFGPLGPQRVLREGHKLISSLDSWRQHGQRWLSLLKALDRATSAPQIRAT